MNPFTRRKARRFLLQALYEWQISGNPLNEIEAALVTKINPKKVDVEYFHQALHDIPAKLDVIDAQLEPCLDRPLKNLNPIELVALRMGVYELRYRIDIPYRVAINEAVEVTKVFGSNEGHKYVNGVLDKLAKELRKAELN
ncbi:MAG: transcriptional terminator nusB [Gammaproteobacteria bacterium]|nr:transcriptional terminator nusB [Gammaproteobacteria bacterium]